ncbi:MAG TPA: hypothetical protein VGP93_03255 [Polyangiaceae bacterium]|jgi:hypothetical protein|nr:hypothetical protein [Polyangiaceae bacterium]
MRKTWALIITIVGSNSLGCGSGNSAGGGTGGVSTGGSIGNGGSNGSGGASSGCEIILNQADLDTGFESCADGTKRRRATIDCPTERTSATSPCQQGFGPPLCTSDAECSTEPLGYCANAHNLTGYCGCYYGCRRDSDCDAGSICECGVVVGRCVPATCTTNADCGAGFGCVGSASGSAATCIVNQADAQSYTCQTAQDECRADEDCPSDGNNEGLCLVDGDHRVCGTLCALTP